MIDLPDTFVHSTTRKGVIHIHIVNFLKIVSVSVLTTLAVLLSGCNNSSRPEVALFTTTVTVQPTAAPQNDKESIIELYKAAANSQVKAHTLPREDRLAFYSQYFVPEYAADRVKTTNNMEDKDSMVLRGSTNPSIKEVRISGDTAILRECSSDKGTEYFHTDSQKVESANGPLVGYEVFLFKSNTGKWRISKITPKEMTCGK